MSENNTNKKVPFPVALLSNIIDQVIIAVIDIVVVLIADFLMQFAGYYVAEIFQMFLILYIFINLIYTPIFESIKKATPGKMLFKVNVTIK